jgi:hypothetical protein
VTERSVVVGRDGRAKAYRPLPEAERAAAISAGLAAYRRGDYFAAHEDLEPAWMGTNDPAERALLQGLIKVAAAYVHDVRGNPAGIERNLTGAAALLREAAEDGSASNAAGIDLRMFGSQGQQRLALLGLLLAEARAIAARRGEVPLLLLDDVLSELDDRRRAALLEGIPKGWQVIVTGTSDRALPRSSRTPDQMIDVTPGSAIAR